MNIVGRRTSKFKGCPSEGLLPTLERPSISGDLLAVLTHRRSPFGHSLRMSLFPLGLDDRRLAFRLASSWQSRHHGLRALLATPVAWKPAGRASVGRSGDRVSSDQQ